MCIPLIAQVLAVDDVMADLELLGGECVRANVTLHPTVGPGEYVLVDRGLVIEVIDAEEAQSMADFYNDLSDLWAEEDARLE